jgi:hypothetical protein
MLLSRPRSVGLVLAPARRASASTPNKGVIAARGDAPDLEEDENMKSSHKILVALTALLLIGLGSLLGSNRLLAQDPFATDEDGSKTIYRYVTSTSTTYLGANQTGTQYSPSCPSGYGCVVPMCYGSTTTSGATALVASYVTGTKAACSFKNTTSSSLQIGAACECLK